MSNDQSCPTAAETLDKAFRELLRYIRSDDDNLMIFYAGCLSGAIEVAIPPRTALYYHNDIVGTGNHVEGIGPDLTLRLQRLWIEVPNDVLVIFLTPCENSPAMVPNFKAPVWGLGQPPVDPNRNIQILSILCEDSGMLPYSWRTALPPKSRFKPGYDLADRLDNFASRGDSLWQLHQELYQAGELGIGVAIFQMEELKWFAMSGRAGFFRLAWFGDEPSQWDDIETERGTSTGEGA